MKQQDDDCSAEGGLLATHGADELPALDFESSCVLLELLPSELVRSILSQQCDGRSLSTFLLVVSSSSKYRRQGVIAVVGALRDRVGLLSSRASLDPFLLFCEQEKDENDLNSVVKVHSCAELAKAIGKWSRGLAVLSFFEQFGCFSAPLDQLTGLPVWCGILRFQFTGTPSLEARVIVTTADWKHGHVHNWHSFMKQSDMIFSPEPRRFVPLGPWGCIKGMTYEDSVTLSVIARGLEDHGEVALPPPSLSTRRNEGSLLNEIRIISRQQVSQRLLDAGFERRADHVVLLNEKLRAGSFRSEYELLAFWNDEEDPASIEDAVDGMIHLMEAKSRFGSGS